MEKTYYLHQVKSNDNKTLLFDTTWLYYRIQLSPFSSQMDTIWYDGKYEEIKKSKTNKSDNRLELQAAKMKLFEQNNIIQVKSDSISHLSKNLDSTNKINAYKQLVKPLQFINYSTIGKQKWTSNNLSESDLKSISKEFILANTDEEWTQLFNIETPAYCYHRDDNNKENGVLLNLFALKLLQKNIDDLKLSWRLPVKSDFDNLLNTLKAVKVFSIASLLTSGTTTIPAWKKPGIDLFDMHIIPLSYRRNNATKWYGQTEATIYCLNLDDPGLSSTLKMVEINDSEEDKNTFIFKSKDVTGEDKNIGVYVRLIKK